MSLLLSTKKKNIRTEHNEKYNYIIEWSKRNTVINDLKSLYDLMFREQTEEEFKKFGEEPLKSAWNTLSTFEQVVLTYELAELYMSRLK